MLVRIIQGDPMAKKYTYQLTASEREQLKGVIKRLSGTSQKVRRAHILLKADAAPDGPCWSDARIAEAYNCRVQTVERIRKRVVEEGLESALESKRQGVPAHNRLLDGNQEAALIAMRLGEPPAGYSNWSLRLLADRVVELGLVDSICPETVRKTLKKME